MLWLKFFSSLLILVYIKLIIDIKLIRSCTKCNFILTSFFFFFFFSFFLTETIVDFIDVYHFVQWEREKIDILLTKQ